MMILLWVLGVLLIVCGLYLWLVAPANEAPASSVELVDRLYAHRGLHDGNVSVPENSLAAFQRAVDNGYGIELDVQLTKDGELVVFHDADLQRVCGGPHLVRELTYDELCSFPLPDGSPIPLFSDVLTLVHGQIPLIVEVKHYGNPTQNAASTHSFLQGYEGVFCVESFHPFAVRYFRKNAPDIMRGQLASGGKYVPGEMSRPTHFGMKHLLMNVLSRPHFVAYSFPADHVPAMWLMKRFFTPPLAAWTIRDQSTLDAAAKVYQMPIFEGFVPEESRV